MTAIATYPAASPDRTFLLGLPYVARGALLDTARDLNAPVLISANGLSKWQLRNGSREWARFRTSTLHLLDGLDAHLDSAGFTAARQYGGYPWTIEDYINLCAAYPWRWFASCDYCVEPEIAPDRETVLDRISLTIRSLHECLRAARDRGIEDRLMPVVQGWSPDDYRRCLDGISGTIETAPLLGVGSVCHRSIMGPNGVLAIVNRIHDELGNLPIRLHLFGVKTQGAALLRDHPRVASFDSQAYGSHARFIAREQQISKTNTFLSSVMRQWYSRQDQALRLPPPPQVGMPFTTYANLTPSRGRRHRKDAEAVPTQSQNAEIERRVAEAREEIRQFVESGELDASWMNDIRAFEWAFDNDIDD